MNADQARSQAARCRRLADGLSNRDDIALFAALAEEYDRQADDLERTERRTEPDQGGPDFTG